MPCMCGDTNCPSCGPAQGHNPESELVAEWLASFVDDPKEWDQLLNDRDVAGIFDKLLGYIEETAETEFLQALVKQAKRWAWLDERIEITYQTMVMLIVQEFDIKQSLKRPWTPSKELQLCINNVANNVEHPDREQRGKLLNDLAHDVMDEWDTTLWDLVVGELSGRTEDDRSGTSDPSGG